MQKALVQMNLQLTEVLSDIMDMTGQAIIRAIVGGRMRSSPAPAWGGGPATRSGSRQRMEFDLQRRLANCTGVDLTGINGMGVGTVMTSCSHAARPSSTSGSSATKSSNSSAVSQR